jgi:hypothetical protein
LSIGATIGALVRVSFVKIDKGNLELKVNERQSRADELHMRLPASYPLLSELVPWISDPIPFIEQRDLL